MDNEVIWVRPDRVRVCLVVIVCALFTAAGLLLTIFGTSTIDAIGGILGVVFFGGGGLYAALKLLNNKYTLIVDDGGVRPNTGGYLPWANIAGIGITYLQGTVKCVGVHVRSPAAYLETFSETEANRMRRASLFAGIAERVTGMRGAGDHSGGHPHGGVPTENRSEDVTSGPPWPGGAELARLLASNRRSTGFDLLWPQTTLNVRGEELIRLCQERSI